MNKINRTNQSKRHKPHGETPTEVRTEITRIYQNIQNGTELVAALKANNFSLVKSTRGVIIVIDRKGGEHNLFKCIKAPREEIESKLDDIEIAKLPKKKCREREAVVKCFLTADEKAEIKTRAKQAELSESGFLRSLVFRGKTRQPKASRRPALEKVDLVQIRYELRKIGGSFTQIAQMQNQSSGFDTVAFSQVCDLHISALKTIMGALGNGASQ